MYGCKGAYVKEMMMNRQELARALVKLAGELAGPGVPDGTGPYGDTEECPMNAPGGRRRLRRRRLRRTGPQDGTGPRGDTDECPVGEGSTFVEDDVRSRGRKYLRTGPQDGTGPRGDTPACPLSEGEIASRLVTLAKSLVSEG